MSDFVIDAFEFCRLKERREGKLPVAALPRLSDESEGKAGEIQWAVQGSTGRHGHAQLALAVAGSVQLICQRCLLPFEHEIASDSTLVLAPDEASADEIDAQLEDEDVEVIVGSHDLDLRQVIEDEALLAIPQSPRHETCAASLPPASAGEKIEKQSPFAVLKNMKK